MSQPNSPAFPIVVGDQMTQGMTLRQYAAIKAMQGILSAGIPHPTLDWCAQKSLEYADTLLKLEAETRK